MSNPPPASRPGNRKAGNGPGLPGWSELRHGGLLLDAQRQGEVAALAEPRVLDSWLQSEVRKRADRLRNIGPAASTQERTEFVAFVLERLCGFTASEASADWLRGSRVPTTWSRRSLTGTSVRPAHLWRGPNGAVLPVFVTGDPQVGIGRGRRETSRALGWLRAGPERLALLTNGRQWRLLFAGLDYDAWCQWDADLWFAEGAPTATLNALLTLVQPSLWTPEEDGADPPLLRAIRDSRKGQAELSESLGERVREAVELLIQGHGDVFARECAAVDPAEIYRAACRVVMRLVVILFAEARGLLPRDDAVYHESYGLGGLHEALRRRAASGRSQTVGYGAWPRLLALFELVRKGSHHPDLAVPAYGGDLFAPGSPTSDDGLSRALSVFETACLGGELLSDAEVHQMLERLTRTRVRIRQGKASRLVTAPVDFSDLSTEYIGVLYEGLLDYELKTAPADDPVIFLSVGEQPALPLSRLEAMDDKALRSLFAAFKKAAANDGDTSKPADDTDDAPPLAPPTSPSASSATSRSAEPGPEAAPDPRQATRTRAEAWARRAALAAGLVRKPRRSSKTQASLLSAHEDEIARRAAQLVNRVVLPGEWYLVRWGGTRKGSGSFYTRPGLTVPTVQRTLRPLAYDPPTASDGEPDRDAPAAEWTPKLPEQILSLKVCDPACGSGSFPLAALRFLTDALYASVQHHGRVESQESRSLVRLLGLEEAAAAPPPPSELGPPTSPPTSALGPPTSPPTSALDAPTSPPASAPGPPTSPSASSAMSRSDEPEFRPGATASGTVEHPGDELIPCPPTAADFEPRLKAVLRRYVVERCIYGVDLDPLAVSLCQLSLWIETMDRDLPFSFLDHKVRCGNSLVGAWFDQFQHYPAMAWKNREAGDKNHSNGVQYDKGARTKAIKAFVRDVLTPDLRRLLEGRTLFHEDLLEQATDVHRQAIDSLERMHRLPIQDSAARARLYREELLGAPAWRSLKQAMDLWCACWFWPADELDSAPLPTAFADPPPATRVAADRIAAENRFFHWELEFPDVFREQGSGFDAMLGNPPWENLQPNPEEFFSNQDPLFRSYGQLAKRDRQREMFAESEQVEKRWLDYLAQFRATANWVGDCADPFGDPASSITKASFPLGRGGAALHGRWREGRSTSRSYSDSKHVFRMQMGRIFSYKLFLEQALALLKNGGRAGLIVPSGIYSDAWSRPLRDALLDECEWEWLFGFENRAKLFPIDSRFKFNPVIVRKGGATEAIRTVFMRRDLTDWERAERIAVPYSREQVRRFSPKSRAILEVESQRDLELLEKIYGNSVLLGDEGPDGWGIRYKLEFMMNTDAHLFPPRPRWEEKGYRPDEYSRWLLGAWRPIEELWAELGIDPDDPEPAAIELEDDLYDPDASRERREAERRFVHGHLLAPGDIDATAWELRCARPPYDRLPVPRTAIPEGVILSREADAWIEETQIQDVALPLYEGRMIGQFDFSQKGWVSGKGRSAVWRDIPWEHKQIEPQYLMAEKDYRQGVPAPDAPKLAHMNIGSGTNERTAIGAFIQGTPVGHSAGVFFSATPAHVATLTAVKNSIVFDFVTRQRVVGLHLDYHVLEQNPVPAPSIRLNVLTPLATILSLTSPGDSPGLLQQFAAGSEATGNSPTDEVRNGEAEADAPGELLADAPQRHAAGRPSRAGTPVASSASSDDGTSQLSGASLPADHPSAADDVVPLDLPGGRPGERRGVSPIASNRLAAGPWPPQGNGASGPDTWRTAAALTPAERVRTRAIADALVASLYGLDEADFRALLAECDQPLSVTTSRDSARLRGKGFWRVDKDKPPELRHTVLTQIAFADLQQHIEAAGGDREAGIRTFMEQNEGEGWLLPETLRLADYNLGHDDRARKHQPVAAELGPRFYDWQLAQTPARSLGRNPPPRPQPAGRTRLPKTPRRPRTNPRRPARRCRPTSLRSSRTTPPLRRLARQPRRRHRARQTAPLEPDRPLRLTSPGPTAPHRRYATRRPVAARLTRPFRPKPTAPRSAECPARSSPPSAF